MKISTIQIQNFRGIHHLSLNFAHNNANFITGLNGAGKSTILEAIRMALFGRCNDAAGKRILQQDLIGPHGDKTRIKIDLECSLGVVCFDLVINRTQQKLSIARQDKTLVFDVPSNQQRDAFWNALKIDKRHAEIACNARAYVLGDEITDLLLEMCSQGVELSELRDFAGPRWEWLEDWLRDMKEIDIDKIATAAVEARKFTKRNIAEFKLRIPEAPLQHPKLKSGKFVEPEDLQAVENALSSLRAKREKVAVDHGVAVRLEGQADEKPDVEALELQLNSSCELVEICATNYNEAESAEKQINQNHAELSRKSHELCNKRDALKRTLSGLKDAKGSCDTCGAKWTKARIEAKTGPLEAELEEVLSALTENSEASKAALTELNTAREDTKTAAQELRQAEVDYSTAQAALDAAIAKTEAPPERSAAELEEELNKLDKQIQAGEKLIADSKAFFAAKEAEESVRSFQVLLDNLEWAVKSFRDGEFAATRVNGVGPKFEAACNEVLNQFGYQLQVATRNGQTRIEVARLGNREGCAIPVPQLSKGERVLVESAVALAYDPGCIICIDDLDALDSSNKSTLLALLKSSEACIIAAGAWGLSDRNLTPLSNFLDGAVYWIGNDEDAKEVAA